MLGLLTLAVGALSAGVVLVRRAAGPRRPPVLLVTVDTLRADRLGCYGHRAAATPVMDALAARGVRFATGIAHVPLTTPSHASMLTGLTPPRHGVRDNSGFVLPDAVPTLAASFRAAGYGTAAFISGFPLDRRFGLARGFDVYDDRLPRGGDRRRAGYVERTAADTTAAVLRWLDGVGGAERPWFLWVHYFDPHAPYEPPTPAADSYDGEVAFVDAELGRLLRRLAPQGDRRRAVVLLTADHGESLGEHGEETHGVFVYDSTLRVPWIVAGPGLPAGTVSAVVARGVDVMPTLLELAGLPVPAGLDGRSLRPAAQGRAMEDAPAYVESLFAQRHLGWAPLTGWRTSAWKLIDAPRPELYALEADAAETADRSRERPEVVARLREKLAVARRARAPQAAAAVTAEARERLAALGYLAASGASEGAGSGRDPKDGIALVNRLERAIAEARTVPERAAAELGAVLAQDPKVTLARRYRAIALAAAGQPKAALAELDTLAAQGPLSAEDLVLRAECLHLAAQAAGALCVLDEAERLDAGSPDPHLTRARVLISLGRQAEAAAAYERVLERAPGHTAALRGLGDLALARGDLSAAAAYYRRVLEADAGDTRALLQLGAVEARAGRLESALALLRQAVERDPASAEALLALAGALAKAGRAAEAVPLFERAVQAGGRSRVALNGLGFARLQAGDAAGAVAALRASLALEPRQPDVADVVRQLTGMARP